MEAIGVTQVRQGGMDDLPWIRSSWPDAADVLERHLVGQQAGGQVVLVARNGSQAVGCVVIRWTGIDTPVARASFPEAPEAAHLFVRRESRNGGVGTALMRSAEQLVVARGFHQLVLAVGLENPGAARLYERLGYLRSGIVELSEYDYTDASGIDRHAVEWNECRVKEALIG
ncbi:MAG: GNAT family N-acetyltransferase [Actinomycetia bacterium]|nr:GNAT family N-acetyltransferase [Actinomycetes bacterium]